MILALLGQFLPEPGHGAVEVMQGQALGPRDGIVLHPRRAVAVRARDEEAVQGGLQSLAHRPETCACGGGLS